MSAPSIKSKRSKDVDISNLLWFILSWVKSLLELFAMDESKPTKSNSLKFDNLKIKFVAIKPSAPVITIFFDSFYLTY